MSDVLSQLVEMTRYLGHPARGYAILGEGNTSARADADTLYVKASGTTMADIDADGFVAVSISKVLPILDDPSAGDADVARVFEAATVHSSQGRRPSVETLLHALLLGMPECVFVGHTHPVYTNMILCSNKAEEAVSGRLFPDQIVSMGHKSVFVPYTDPGLALAREVKKRLDQFVKEEGCLPTAILMQNHGLIALGKTAKAVTSCTDMTEKASRILVGTYALGGPHFMPASVVERIVTRPDEAYRVKKITGANWSAR